MSYSMNRYPFNRVTNPLADDLYVRYDEIGNPPSPPGTFFRITEAGDMRVTELGFDRIIE